MERQIALVLGVMLALGGCQYRGTFCDIATIHSFTGASVDAMTDEEVNREEAHNEKVDACP